MDGSASPTCWKMDSPEAASAPGAEKAMASPKEMDFFTGGGGGGVAAELEASVV